MDSLSRIGSVAALIVCFLAPSAPSVPEEPGYIPSDEVQCREALEEHARLNKIARQIREYRRVAAKAKRGRITVSVPEDLLERLDQLSSSRGVPKHEIVSAALNSFFGEFGESAEPSEIVSGALTANLEFLESGDESKYAKYFFERLADMSSAAIPKPYGMPPLYIVISPYDVGLPRFKSELQGSSVSPRRVIQLVLEFVVDALGSYPATTVARRISSLIDTRKMSPPALEPRPQDAMSTMICVPHRFYHRAQLVAGMHGVSITDLYIAGVTYIDYLDRILEQRGAGYASSK